MDWQPLLDASLPVRLHVAAALAAIVTGAIVLWRRKGGGWHRALGRLWVAAMLATAISAFWINDIRLWGAFSPLHIFSVLVPVNLAVAVWAARTGRIALHRNTMRGTYVGALGVAGTFALLPGRMLWDVLTGGVAVGGAAGAWLAAHGWTLPLMAALLPFAVGVVVRTVRRATGSTRGAGAMARARHP